MPLFFERFGRGQLVGLISYVPPVLAIDRQCHLANTELANYPSASKGSHRLSAIVRPEIDKEAFARILLELAQLRVDEERAAKKGETDSTSDA